MADQKVVEREAVESADGRSGKFLTFRLGGEEYGVPILKVREIIGLMPVTAVPRTPDFLRGVINLRGRVIPVVDLRKKFGMESAPDTEETCVIVIDAVEDGETLQTGVVVDSVSEVLDIRDEETEKTPSFGSDVDSAFILGIAKTDGSVRILLDMDEILTAVGVLDLGQAARASDEEDDS